MNKNKPTIYLADLTHTSGIVASNVAPLGIGLIAAHLLKTTGGSVDIELFKYPHDLDEALSRQIPSVIGFANYSWNCDIAYKFATKIKEAVPKTVIVFGGPNYGLTQEEMAGFWKRHPLIDFYVVGEGELAFSELYDKLTEVDFNADLLRYAPVPPFNCHFLRDGSVIKGNILERIDDLDAIGSPYLMGLMDKFFDNVLIPMIHTTRGCPFTCTYCSEGNPYYSKVARRDNIFNELAYIAERRGKVEDLIITDANFGMYKEDINKAETIAAIQKQYQWPRHIFVSTGKNLKERVIKVAKILRGAISITASLQTTDKAILKNIKRSNISLDALNTIVREGNKADASTYSEIILGLPGDTLSTHTNSLRDVVNSGLGMVRMYQLILLPQTEMNTPESREKYGIESKFRINPRSFGKYDILGTNTVAIEIEEICVSTNTLSFEDYLQCRELDLTIEMVHNSGIFLELYGLSQWLNISWFDFILGYHNKRRSDSNKLRELYDNFNADNRNGLWNSIEELEQDVSSRIDEFLSNKEGTNEISKFKAKALTCLLNELHDILYYEMGLLLKIYGHTNDKFTAYLKEVREFSILRKKDFISTSNMFTFKSHFDLKAIEENGFEVDPRDFYHQDEMEFRIFHSDEQKDIVRSYITQYGNSIDGIGRILMRAPAKWLIRSFSPN